MNPSTGALARLRAINDQAPFNRWCGIEVVSAEPGSAVIAMPWRPEAGQYAGFLHAGLIGALIDTACTQSSRSALRSTGMKMPKMRIQTRMGNHARNCNCAAKHIGALTPRCRLARMK